MSTSFKGRALAIIAGCAFAAGGLTILLDKDLLHPMLWTSAHWLTVLTIFGTITAGHLMADAARARHLLAALGFFALFLSGTALVVYSSVGRQVETQGITTLSTEDKNDKIAGKTEDLRSARARMAYAESQVQKTMTGSYCGRGCKDWKQNAKDVAATIKQTEAEIAALGPQKPVNAKAEAMAEIAMLLHVPGTREQIVAALVLIMPFATTIFFEVGSIVAFGFAFRAGKQRLPVPANDPITISNDFRGPGGGKPLERLPENVVELHPVVKALESVGGEVSSNQELARLMNVTEGESSKRWQEIEDQLEVRKVGKHLRIALRA
jgi:hypothetical protein